MGEAGLQDVFTLQIRRQTNASNPSPYCEACKNGFVHVNSLQVRQFTQSGKLPGVCKACNEAFLRICRLQIRHLTHSDSHPHVCQTCGKSFTHAGNIRKHMLLHEKRDMQSNEELRNEDGTISDPSSKQEKLTPVRPQPPFECEQCGKKFVKYGCFLNHNSKHIQSSAAECENNGFGDAAIDLPSEISGQNSSTIDDSLMKNSDISDTNALKVFSCDQCDKSFTKYGFLLRHYQIHEMDSFDCQVCKKTFKTKPLLSSHMRTHKHVCKLCKESFAVPEDLEVHLQNHLQQQTVVATKKVPNHYCSVCQKGFVHLGHLRKHFLSHTGNGCEEPNMPEQKLKPLGKNRIPLHCDVCNQRFKFRRTLKKHMALHK